MDKTPPQAKATGHQLPSGTSVLHRMFERGVKELKISRYTFKPTKSGTGLNVYGASKYLGTIGGDRFYPSADCGEAQLKDVGMICSDPKKHAIQHGKKTGICAVCGSPLTDPDSVRRGVGPTCYRKF